MVDFILRASAKKQYQKKYTDAFIALLKLNKDISRGVAHVPSAKAKLFADLLGTTAAAPGAIAGLSSDPIVGTIAGLGGVFLRTVAVAVVRLSENDRQRTAQGIENNLDLDKVDNLEEKLTLILGEVSYEISNIWEAQITRVTQDAEMAKMAKDAAYRSLHYAASLPSDTNSFDFKKNLIEGVLRGTTDTCLRGPEKQIFTDDGEIFKVGNVYSKPGVLYPNGFDFSENSHHIKTYGARAPISSTDNDIENHRAIQLPKSYSHGRVFGIEVNVIEVCYQDIIKYMSYVEHTLLPGKVSTFNDFIRTSSKWQITNIRTLYRPENDNDRTVDITGGDFSGSAFFNTNLTNIDNPDGRKTKIDDTELYYCTLAGFSEDLLMNAHQYSYQFGVIEVGAEELYGYIDSIKDLPHNQTVESFNDYVAILRGRSIDDGIEAIYRRRSGDAELNDITNITGGNFSGSVFFDLDQSGKIIGTLSNRETDLSKTRLFGFKARNAELSYVDFSESIMPLADLTNAVMSRCKLVRTEARCSELKRFNAEDHVTFYKTDISYSYVKFIFLPDIVDRILPGDDFILKCDGCAKELAKRWPGVQEYVGKVIPPEIVGEQHDHVVREEYVEEIEAIFRQYGNVCILAGTPTIGKLSIVKSYANKFYKNVSEDESTLVFYIDLSKEDRVWHSKILQEAFREFAKKLNEELYNSNIKIPDIASGRSEERKLIDKIYDTLSDFESLIIIKGADPSAIKGYLPDRVLPNIRILITSRNCNRKLWGEIERVDRFYNVLNVGAFLDVDSMLYLITGVRDLLSMPEDDMIGLKQRIEYYLAMQSLDGSSLQNVLTPRPLSLKLQSPALGVPEHAVGSAILPTKNSGPIVHARNRADGSQSLASTGALLDEQKSRYDKEEARGIYTGCLDLVRKLHHHPFLIRHLIADIRGNDGVVDGAIKNKASNVFDEYKSRSKIEGNIIDTLSTSLSVFRVEIRATKYYKYFMVVLMLDNRKLTKDSLEKLGFPNADLEGFIDYLQSFSIIVPTILDHNDEPSEYKIDDMVQYVLLRGLVQEGEMGTSFIDSWNHAISKMPVLPFSDRYAILDKYQYLVENNIDIKKYKQNLQDLYSQVGFPEKLSGDTSRSIKQNVIHAINNRHFDLAELFAEDIVDSALDREFIHEVIIAEIVVGNISLSQHFLRKVYESKANIMVQFVDYLAAPFTNIKEPSHDKAESEIKPIRGKPRAQQKSFFSSLRSPRSSKILPTVTPVESDNSFDIESQDHANSKVAGGLDEEIEDIVRTAIRISYIRNDAEILRKLSDSEIVEEFVLYEFLFKERVSATIGACKTENVVSEFVDNYIKFNAPNTAEHPTNMQNKIFPILFNALGGEIHNSDYMINLLTEWSALSNAITSDHTLDIHQIYEKIYNEFLCVHVSETPVQQSFAQTLGRESNDGNQINQSFMSQTMK